MMNWKKSWPDQWEGLPVDVLPCSNEEYIPAPPTKEQLAIMHLQDREIERWRRHFNMSRRRFVRISAAMAIGFWCIDAVVGGEFGNYGNAFASNRTPTLDACDLKYTDGQGLESVANLPGEVVFDIQSHHVDPTGDWRAANPAVEAFFAALWPQSSCALGDKPGIRDDHSIHGCGAGEIDPMENLSRFHYFKELFLDSATTMTVLSVVPTSPDTNNPLPIAEAALTAHTANDMSKAKRTILHSFVMPNRGSAGMTQQQLLHPAGVQGPKPLYFDAEMQQMWERAELYKDILGGWKTYCAWGAVPYASGWWLDSDYGMEFLKTVRAISDKHPEIPPVLATHKGFSLPGFDQRGASPRDVGPAASANPGVRFMIYHSGYDIFNYNGVPIGGKPEAPYAGDANVDSSNRTVDSFIKSLRENGLIAANYAEPGKTFGNVPNVWAELGSVWRDQVANGGADGCCHLLGKLITHVGPKRIAWGTDSLWYGSPQSIIVALRRLQFTDKAKEFYNLPYGLDGDVEDPTQPAPSPDRTIRNGILGRNAAEAYNIDPDAARNSIDCAKVNSLRKEDYIKNIGDGHIEEVPLASNQVLGPRTRRGVLKGLFEGPWAP